MKNRMSIFMVGLALALSAPAITTVSAAAETASSDKVAADQNQPFFKKKYKIQGSWSLTERDGKTYVTFSDDFKTKNGPDLKVFLSPTSADDANGKNAVDGSINIGKLKSNKGAQEYEIPAGTDLSKYSTVLVHCEAYSILWGGGKL